MQVMSQSQKGKVIIITINPTAKAVIIYGVLTMSQEY